MLLEQAADPNTFDDNEVLNTNINRTLGNLQEDASGVFLTKPIADLFPEATGTYPQTLNRVDRFIGTNTGLSSRQIFIFYD